MVLLILFDVYIILGVIAAIINYKAVHDLDADTGDFGKMADRQRLVYRTCNQYYIMAIVTITWLPSLIIGLIQYAKWKNS